MGGVGENACDAGALRRKGVSQDGVLQRKSRTVLGPAPMMMARPDGGIVMADGACEYETFFTGDLCLFCWLEACKERHRDHLKTCKLLNGKVSKVP